MRRGADISTDASGRKLGTAQHGKTWQAFHWRSDTLTLEHRDDVTFSRRIASG